MCGRDELPLAGTVFLRLTRRSPRVHREVWPPFATPRQSDCPFGSQGAVAREGRPDCFTYRPPVTASLWRRAARRQRQMSRPLAPGKRSGTSPATPCHPCRLLAGTNAPLRRCSCATGTLWPNRRPADRLVVGAFSRPLRCGQASKFLRGRLRRNDRSRLRGVPAG